MRKLRIVLFIISMVLLTFYLFDLDYSNLNWSNNKGTYLGIVSMACLGFAMIISNHHDRKRAQK